MQSLSRSICAFALSAVFLSAASPVLAQASCGMARIARHADPKQTSILASTSGEKALYFASDLDVNTDGAARSYHPEDPRGQSLALNNMGNAITRIFDSAGRNITCSPRSGACYTRFIETFEAARDAGYPASGAPRIETARIIPWRMDPRLGRQVPCTITSGPFEGYFVSQTALVVNSQARICDQSRYLDAMKMNAIVLPRGVSWSSQGTVTDGGDLAVVLDEQTGRHAFALVGDRGPAKSIGEGTVALAAALGNKMVPGDANFRTIKRLKREKVHTVIFPTRDVPRLTGGNFTQADVDRLGQEALQAFGGIDRLRACAGLR